MQFWHLFWKEYKELSGIIITELIIFLLIHLYEQDFSIFALMKTKNRKRIDAEHCLILAKNDVIVHA